MELRSPLLEVHPVDGNSIINLYILLMITFILLMIILLMITFILLMITLLETVSVTLVYILLMMQLMLLYRNVTNVPNSSSSRNV